MCNVNVFGVTGGNVKFVAVFEPTEYDCAPGFFLGANETLCTVCPENNYCPGGKYVFSETVIQGINPCPDGLVAPAGMFEVAQCGRRFHVDGAVLYLRKTNKTKPSLLFDMDGDGRADFYANLTTADTAMNKDTDKKLKVSVDGVVYSVYDDTIVLQ